MSTAQHEPINLMDFPGREVTENEPETSSSALRVHGTNVPEDPTPEQIMRLVELSGTLDFWDRPEEDIYSLGHGEPL